MELQIVMLCTLVLMTAGEDYGKLKLWSLTRGSTGVVNVTSASIVIPNNGRQTKDMKITPPINYIFKPRAIPLKSEQEKNIYYSPDSNSKYKSEILFPGNYFTIAKEKSSEDTKPLKDEPFKPKTIPLMRGQEFQKRSLDVEVSGEDPEYSEQTASRRSLSYVLGVEDEDEENEDDDGDYETDDDVVEQKEGTLKSKIKHRIKKAKKYSKYMMPLLLAYKLKYFALVPVMIAGLVLLVGATGMAGFFFALFAAVMGLQKGGY